MPCEVEDRASKENKENKQTNKHTRQTNQKALNYTLYSLLWNLLSTK